MTVAGPRRPARGPGRLRDARWRAAIALALLGCAQVAGAQAPWSPSATVPAPVRPAPFGHPAYPVPAPAWTPRGPAESTLPAAALLLEADDAPQRIDHYRAAGGPLERHTGRPGAWYAAVFVPMPARAPLQLWAWQRNRMHLLRVAALDDWPPAMAQTAVSLPLIASATASGRTVLRSAAFALPAASTAEGAYLLIEQWSAVGERPAPIWLQVRSAQLPYGAEHRRGDGAWWSPSIDMPTSTPHAAQPARSPAPILPPPSPLLAPRDAATVIELPFLRAAAPPRPSPTFVPWWER